MGKLLTPRQMEMQAAAFKTFLDGGGEWALKGNVANFAPTYRNDGLPVTVTGVNNVDNFALAGKSITVPADSYDTDTQITVAGEGYNFTSNDIINVAVEKGTVEIFNAPSTVKVDGENTCVENISASDVILFGETCVGSSLRYADDVTDITASVDNIFVGGGASNNSIKILPHEGAVTEGITVSGGAGVDSVDLSQNTILSGSATLHGSHVIENNNSCISVKGFTENDTIQIAGAVDLDYIKGNSSIIGANYLDIHNTFYFVGLSTTSNISLPGMSGGTAIHLMDKNGNIIYPEFCVPKAVTFTDAAEIVTLDSQFSDYAVDMRGGNDTVIIAAGAEDVSLNTGAGVDSVSISSSAGECTIYTGAGFDTIHNANTTKKHVYQLTGTEGNKVIRGFTRFDYLQIMDDSAFTPAVFAPTDTDYIPVSIGNARVSIQGNLYQVPCVKILDKDGEQIGFNNSNGVVIKSDDVTVDGTATVDGCNCIVAATGTIRLTNPCDGVTIYTASNAHPAALINNISDGDAGNNYVFVYNPANGNRTDSLQGFCPDVDHIYIHAQMEAKWVTIFTPTVSINANDWNVCNQCSFSRQLFNKDSYTNYYFNLKTLKPFYGDTLTLYLKKGSNAEVGAPLDFSTGYYAKNYDVTHNCSTAALITNDKVKRFVYTGGVGVIQSFPNGTCNSNAPVTVTSEAAGSAVTMKGGVVQAKGCTISSNGTMTDEAGGNTIYLNAANSSVTLDSAAESCNVVASKNGDSIFSNGKGNTIKGVASDSTGNSTINIYNFNKDKDVAGINNDSKWYSITKGTFDGGVIINVQLDCSKITHIKIWGLGAGDSVKFAFTNKTVTYTF